jgi:hypothetical protein
MAQMSAEKERKRMQTQQGARKKEGIDFKRLWWVGLLLIAITVVINFVLYTGVLVFFPTVKIEMEPTIFYTGLGTFGAVLVFGLIGWLVPHPITLYQMTAGGVLVLSFIPDIILFTRGGSLIEVGAYMLMHIVTAVICVVGLTTFTQTMDAR